MCGLAISTAMGGVTCSCIYTPGPVDESAYTGYTAGPWQYNPHLMD